MNISHPPPTKLSSLLRHCILRWIWCLWCYSKCISIHTGQAWNICPVTVGIEHTTFEILAQYFATELCAVRSVRVCDISELNMQWSVLTLCIQVKMMFMMFLWVYMSISVKLEKYAWLRKKKLRLLHCIDIEGTRLSSEISHTRTDLTP
jgi:hypothetical protein